MQNPGSSPSGSDDRDETVVDPSEDAFEDWVDHVAEAEGVPAKAVRARLMSSYWILDEVARHLEDASFKELSDEFADEEFTAADDPSDREHVRAVLEDLVDETDAPDLAERVEQDQPSWEVLVELVRSLDGFGHGDDGDHDDEAGEQAEVPAVLDELEQDVRDLDDQLESLQARWDERYDEVWNQLDELEDVVEGSVKPSDLEAIEDVVEGQLAELDGSLQSLETKIHEEVQQLSADLSEHADAFGHVDQHLTAHADRIETLDETVSGLADRLQGLEDHVTSQRDRIAQFESTIDANSHQVEDLQQALSIHDEELQSAEKVLRHLFGETDRLDERLSVVAGVIRDLEPVVSAHHDREHVAELKRNAARIGSRQARCEACGEQVDVGLLTEPACPHCGTRAEHVTERTGLIRSKTVLETAESSETPDHEPNWAADLENVDRDRDGGAPRGGQESPASDDDPA